MVVARMRSGAAHTMKVMEKIVEGGGEGLILQQRGSLYHRGRTPSLLKIKVLSFLLSFLLFPSLFLFILDCASGPRRSRGGVRGPKRIDTEIVCPLPPSLHHTSLTSFLSPLPLSPLSLSLSLSPAGPQDPLWLYR